MPFHFALYSRHNKRCLTCFCSWMTLPPRTVITFLYKVNAKYVSDIWILMEKISLVVI
jgi:hypothetical protein